MKLQELRNRAGYSQAGLAEAAGLSYSLIRNIEQGQKRIEGMSGDRLYRLALVLNCRMEDFLDTASLVREVISAKNYAGLTWGSLSEVERDVLLVDANAADGRTGSDSKESGECIIDLPVYPFSVPGRIDIGEWENVLHVSDDAIIYSTED